MTTQFQFIDRDAVITQAEHCENPATLREDATENEKAITELLNQLLQARTALRMTERDLAILEQSLAGRAPTAKQ